ncbi:MAG: hypothetical protein KDA60_22530 [Planctomycetales bacterium]|nr:hypothetical protein [Planctomycetales bacterium]
MQFFAPLFADLDDIIKLVILILFFVGPVVGKLFQGANQAKRPRPQPPARPQQPAGAGQPGGKAVGGPQALENEIEAFLRQATAKARRLPVEDEPLTAEIVEDEPVRALRPASEPMPSATRPEPQMGGSVRSHVNQHLGSHEVSDHAAALGENLRQSDERVESRLHDVFDHQVGSLKSTSTKKRDRYVDEGTDASVWDDISSSRQRQEDNARRVASEIRAIAEHPERVRQAIIWAEILKRPDERE